MEEDHWQDLAPSQAGFLAIFFSAIFSVSDSCVPFFCALCLVSYVKLLFLFV